MKPKYESYTKCGKYTVAIWNHEPGDGIDNRETHGFGYHVDIIDQKPGTVVAVFGAYGTDLEAKAAFNVAVKLVGAGRISWKRV